MASKNVKNWDLPLPPSEESVTEEDDFLSPEEKQFLENEEKLKKYIKKMAYCPVAPPVAKKRIEELAKAKPVLITENAKMYSKVYEPKQRSERMKKLAEKYNAITTE